MSTQYLGPSFHEAKSMSTHPCLMSGTGVTETLMKGPLWHCWTLQPNGEGGRERWAASEELLLGILKEKRIVIFSKN